MAVKIAIIGAEGHWETALSAKGQAEYAAFCCPEEQREKMEAAFARAGIGPPVYFGNWRSMLQKICPQVVVVDGPFHRHAAMAAKALARGMHVFCEKPLAFNLEQLALLQKAAEASGAALWGMHTMRFYPWAYTVKRLIQSGEIGRVRLIQLQKSYKLGSRPAFYRERQLYGGTLPWVGVHEIDLIRFLYAGAFTEVYAHQSAVGNGGLGSLEATAQCQFVLAGGVCASLSVDYLRPATAPSHEDDRLRVVGTLGVAEARGGRVFLSNAKNNEREPLLLCAAPDIFQSFLKYALEGKKGLLTTRECLEACAVSLLARCSADEKRAVEIVYP
ncbi:MAG: Gfo/Idh/MocA family protein [Oscillospiraceae bacterium]